MRRTKLLVNGLQRTGTNYLEVLLKRRYRVRIVNAAERSAAGHKHARLYPDKALIPEPQYRNDLHVVDYVSFEALLEVVPDQVLVISKDPYSWYLSYRKFGERCGWPPPDHHYIDEYNAYYGTWLQLAATTSRVHFVRYIDLLAEPDAALHSLAAALDLTPRIGGREGGRGRRARPVRRVRRVPVSGTFSADSAEYYLEAKYLDEYDDATLAELNERVDAGVVEQLGYSLSPARH